MTKEEIKDELYRMLSYVVNGGYPIRNNTQHGRYREAVKEAIEALEIFDIYADTAYECGKHANKWIPVNERLPEDGTWCLFTCGNCISVERYKADAIDHFCPPGRWFQFDEVVAWMPLPEHYKESEE